MLKRIYFSAITLVLATVLLYPQSRGYAQDGDTGSIVFNVANSSSISLEVWLVANSDDWSDDPSAKVTIAAGQSHDFKGSIGTFTKTAPIQFLTFESSTNIRKIDFNMTVVSPFLSSYYAYVTGFGAQNDSSTVNHPIQASIGINCLAPVISGEEEKKKGSLGEDDCGISFQDFSTN